MFRRKEDGTEELISDNESAPSSASSSSATTPTSSSPVTPAITPAAPLNPVPAAPIAQPASFRPAPPQAAMAASRSAANLNPTPATPAPSAPNADASRTPSAPVARPAAKRVLTVGPEIQMKGEITSCDRVVIEGVVDATMRDVHTVELTETGTLKGTAEVEDAEISGTFEGDLLVRGKLTLNASGRVRGNVTYGEIEIQRGGQISGNVRNVADAKNAALGGKKAA